MPNPGKGHRFPFTVRVPSEHADVYARAAARHGMKKSDYLAWVLAEAHGLEAPDWIQPEDRQEVLTESA